MGAPKKADRRAGRPGGGAPERGEPRRRGAGGAARRKGEGGGREPWKGMSEAAAGGQEPEPSLQRCPQATRQRWSAQTQRCMRASQEEGGISEAWTWPLTCWMTEQRSCQGAPRERALGQLGNGQKKEGREVEEGVWWEEEEEGEAGEGRLGARPPGKGEGGGTDAKGEGAAWGRERKEPWASSAAQRHGRSETHALPQTGQRGWPEGATGPEAGEQVQGTPSGAIRAQQGQIKSPEGGVNEGMRWLGMLSRCMVFQWGAWLPSMETNGQPGKGHRKEGGARGIDGSEGPRGRIAEVRWSAMRAAPGSGWGAGHSGRSEDVEGGSGPGLASTSPSFVRFRTQPPTKWWGVAARVRGWSA